MYNKYMNTKKGNAIIWVIICFVVIGGLFFWGSINAKKSQAKKEVAYTGKTSREVALICTTDMATQFHIHPEIRIGVNGKEVTIPSNIGIKQNCMNSIHTHDATGLIHVESPAKKDFTLGDFFAVWDKDFSKDTLLGNKIDATNEIVVSVNGSKVDTFENTIMKDKDMIVISYQKK